MSAGLEDVNVRPAKNAIATVLDHRSITGAKPAVAESVACCVGLAPVFREHTRTADFDLARCSRNDPLAILSDRLNFDVGKRRSDAPGHTYPPQRVPSRHADLRHTVALDHGMAANFLPALER